MALPALDKGREDKKRGKGHELPLKQCKLTCIALYDASCISHMVHVERELDDHAQIRDLHLIRLVYSTEPA